MAIESLILKTVNDWTIPRLPKDQEHVDEIFKVRLTCTANANNQFESNMDASIPMDLRDFWKHFESCVLFTDSQKTIWGLSILSYDEAIAATQAYFESLYSEAKKGDLIIGQFHGDLDQLLIRSDVECGDYGWIYVKIPDGFRTEWYLAAKSFLSFLQQYIEEEGRKYWET